MRWDKGGSAPPLGSPAVGSAKGVDFKKELEPMRAVRPANGGVGWSEEAIVWLRTTGAVDVSSLAKPPTE